MVFITLFSLIKNRNISFVCLQDPPLFQGSPLRAPGYQVHYSGVMGRKTRIATYVPLALSRDFTYLCFTPAVDVFHMLISRIDGAKIIEGFEKLSLINTYNRQIDGENTVAPSDLFTT